MHLTIIHGNHHNESRTLLREIVDLAKEDDKQVTELNGENLTRADLETALLAENLFEQRILVIENILSRTKSKAKESCIETLVQYSGDKHVVLWERKAISKTLIKKFIKHNPQEKSFNFPLIIFSFVASLKPGNTNVSINKFHQSLESASNTFIFAMLAKQVAKLIIAKTSPRSLPGVSWQNNKVLAQAKSWSLKQLKSAHSDLLNIDEGIKTGTTKLDLTEQLDLFLLEL